MWQLIFFGPKQKNFKKMWYKYFFLQIYDDSSALKILKSQNL